MESRTIRRTPERRLLAAILAVTAVLEAAMLLGGPLAKAASVTSASVAGGAGTYQDGSTLYVRAVGGGIRVVASTSSDTRCLRVQGQTPSGNWTYTSSTARSSWDVDIPKPVSAGLVSLKVSASPSFNAGGNCTGATSGDVTVTATAVVDGTAPVVSGALTPAPNAAGWNNADVAVAWSASDPSPGSGVAAGSPDPASASVTGETAGATRSSEAFDRVGNRGEGSVVVHLDETPPDVTTTRAPAANAAGWTNEDVTVRFACSDALSGVQSCPAPVTVTEEGEHSVTRDARDNADNTTTAVHADVHIDKTPPALAGTPATAPAGGWHTDDVTIGWTCADALSGVATCPADATIGGEGEGLQATGTAADKAGNERTSASAAVKIDRHAPVTSAIAPGGWSMADADVRLVAEDALSGVASTHYALDGAAPRAYDDAAGIAVAGDGVHALEYWSEDRAGNAEPHRSVEVKVDRAAPAISHTLTPAANAFGWHRDDVAVRFVCTDTLSGVATCTGDADVTEEGAGQEVEGAAADVAGNTATDLATVSLDRTPPRIDATRSAQPNDAGWNAAPVIVTFTCSDPLSGVRACSVAETVAETAGITATGTARDAAGNEAEASEGPIRVDLTPPALAGRPVEDANEHGWYRGDVAVEWTCEDALSGVVDCPGSVTLTGEGATETARAAVSDAAGNTTEALSRPVGIDRTAPHTTARVPAPLPSGWYAGAVTVGLDATDALSRVDATFYSVDGGEPQRYTGPFEHARRGVHTLRFWSVDRAGNTETHDEAHTITLKIDDVAPSIAGRATPEPNAHGWNRGDVDVTFGCDDAESGIASCVGDQTLTAETTAAGTTVTGNAQDNAGNTAEARVGPIRIDKTPPTLVPVLPDADGVDAAGDRWYTGDVEVRWTCADGLSGLAGDCPAPAVVDGEGRGLSAGPVTVEDKAGNAAGATASGINVDRGGPQIAPSVPAANAAGWHREPVTVSFACADPELADGGAGSGTAACPEAEQVVSEGANQEVRSGPARDFAGNETAGAVVGGLNVDATAPRSAATVECAGAGGYCNGDTPVIVRLAAADQPGLSGAAAIRHRVGDGAWRTTEGDAATLDLGVLATSGKAVIEYQAVDAAGNAEPVRVETVNHDGAKPAVTHTLDPEANAAGWSLRDTLVTFSATDDDGGSGVDLGSLTPPRTYADETAGLSLTGEAFDTAGNRGTDTFTLKLDKTAPTISGTRTPAQGDWSREPVSVSFACADPAAANGSEGSGVAECLGAETLSTSNKAGAPQSVTGTVRDVAGNAATATVGGIDIDTELPTVTVTGVVDGGRYVLGAVPAPGCEASDSYSGLDGACRTSRTGGTANGVGQYAYTATATDKAGNTTTRTVRYSVVYAVPDDAPFFLQPINDTAHTASATLSVFKAGGTVPVKFQLRDASGRVVQANTAPVWLTPAKGSATTAPVDESEFSAPADVGTAYRWSDQQYIYNWQTAKAQAGSYWRIGVRLDDGQVVTTFIGLR